MVASIIMYSLSGSLAKDLKIRSKTPLFAHRLKRWCTIFQSPKRAGRSRQGKPTATEQGLIAYECSKCGYLMSVLQPPLEREAG
jgi:hypothetical protein